MQIILVGLVISSLSYLAYMQLKPSRRDMRQLVTVVNAQYDCEFSSEPYLGHDDIGFLFDEKNRKVCYLRGAGEVELISFDYFRSWQLTRAGDPGFLFLTVDSKRPVMTIRVSSMEEVTIWRRRLADMLPVNAPQGLAA